MADHPQHMAENRVRRHCDGLLGFARQQDERHEADEKRSYEERY
jgi:hypothetical protein